MTTDKVWSGIVRHLLRMPGSRLSAEICYNAIAASIRCGSARSSSRAFHRDDAAGLKKDHAIAQFQHQIGPCSTRTRPMPVRCFTRSKVSPISSTTEG